jgi:hypothetical protein
MKSVRAERTKVKICDLWESPLLLMGHKTHALLVGKNWFELRVLRVAGAPSHNISFSSRYFIDSSTKSCMDFLSSINMCSSGYQGDGKNSLSFLSTIAAVQGFKGSKFNANLNR